MAVTYEIAMGVVNALSDKDKDRVLIALQKEKEEREGTNTKKEKPLTQAEIIVKKALLRNQINNRKKNRGN